MEQATKKVGVWMESSITHLMEFSKEPLEIKTIESNFRKKQSINNSEAEESILHNKEKNKKLKYFNKIIDMIADYNEVVLFGPYNSKIEFFNVMAADNRFQNSKKVLLAPLDRMTPGQQKRAFVKGYYAKK